MDNIDHILSLEVKKEIADRYFGFRKVIEDDTAVYLASLEDLRRRAEENIGADLHCIYFLLRKETLIDRFIALCNLPGRLYYDTFRPAEGCAPVTDRSIRGFTRKGCMRNVFFDAYDSLSNHVREYRKSYERLQEDRLTISEQIRIFYRKNDIHTILDFLRGLDAFRVEGEIGYNAKSRQELEEKLKIDPPPPVEEMLPAMLQPPPAKSIKGELKALITEACRHRPNFDLRNLHQP